MKYALSLAEDGRILSVTYEKYAHADAVLVDSLPEGDTYDYRYVDSKFIYDPLPIEEVVEVPTQLDRMESQLAYLAMMTGNEEILEV